VLLFLILLANNWLDVPFVPQREDGCGAASIAMVMQYWVRHNPDLNAAAADSDLIYKLLTPTRRRGVSGQALKDYVQKNGFKAFIIDGEFNDLEQHLAKGRPVVACLAPRGPRSPLHYVVVVGATNDAVLFHDPVRGKLTREDRAQFLQEWKVTKNWMLLAVPNRAAEATAIAAEVKAQPADLELNRGLELAKTGKLDEAEQVFREGQRAFSSDPRFGLELAGVAYRRKATNTAKKELRTSLHLDPSNAYGNEFLGSLYLLDGNLHAALKYWNRIDKPLIQDVRFDPVPSLDPLLRDRSLEISGGQVLTRDRLRATETNLDRLRVFANYRFDLAPRADQRFDLTVVAREKSPPMKHWIGRLLPIAGGLPFRTVPIDIQSSHSAIQFGFFGRWDPNKRRVGLSFSAPLNLNPRMRYRLSADARDERWDFRRTYFARPEFLDSVVLRKIEAGAELEFGITGKLQWTPSVWFARRIIRNGDPNDAFADSWSMELRNRLSYRIWDSPERRIRLDGRAQLGAGRVFSGLPSRMILSSADLRANWFPQAKSDDLEVILRAGIGKAYGRLPFDELYMLGLERDNDLWMRGHVGSHDGRKGNAPLGTQYTLFQSEVNRTVLKSRFGNVLVGPFFDVGTISDSYHRFGSSGWMQDTGVQAKLRSRGGFTLSLIYGRDLRDGRGAFYATVTR
jgi:predicted double-glycine peptidase